MPHEKSQIPICVPSYYHVGFTTADEKQRQIRRRERCKWQRQRSNANCSGQASTWNVRKRRRLGIYISLKHETIFDSFKLLITQMTKAVSQ